jgi:predicted acyltransferase
VKTAGVERLGALDQFRGYTVVGMLAVNFLGEFDVVPAILKHHNTYCSYADTIMPQFFVAVGLALRLTFARRLARDGLGAAYGRAVWRAFGLVLLGVVYHGVGGRAATWEELERLGLVGALGQAFGRDPFQALVHIGLTALWVTPVAGASWPWVLGYGAASATLYVVMLKGFYFDYAWNRPVIDGGPLGFMGWAVPTIVGMLAYDVVMRVGGRRSVGWLLAGGVGLMVLGQAMTGLSGAGFAPLPFVEPEAGREVGLWTMSQRTVSISYMTFSAGWSLVVLAGFVWAGEGRGWEVPVFRTFGSNALAAYVLHGMVAEAVIRYAPRDAPGWYVAVAAMVYLGICWVLVRGLERRGIYVRI